MSGSPHLSVLSPVHDLFQSYLGAAWTARPGAQHMLNADYFKRIDAMNFTLLHDDGQLPDDLEEADVLLLGVSRTSKTPTSIYLANRGVKTANVPLIPGVPLPPRLETVKRPSWSASWRARSASCRSGRTGCSASRRTTTRPMSIRRPSRRRSPIRGGYAPGTIGRSSM